MMRYATIKLMLAAGALSMLSACSSWPWTHTSGSGDALTGIETPVVKPTQDKVSVDVGELRYQVETEHLAKDNGCERDPTARLLERGPGYETYTVPCGSAQMMVIRCDFSYCRQSH
jgi:hypothetical protein